MATIKTKGMGRNQFGGVTGFGNLTTLRASLLTAAAGALVNATTTAAPAVGDVIQLQLLPEGMLLEDAQVVVSDHFGASVTGTLGFAYADGVDSTTVPQDAAYFGSIALSAAARVRTTSSKAPVTLDKDAYLTLTIAGAAIAEAGRADFIVHGERLGSK